MAQVNAETGKSQEYSNSLDINRNDDRDTIVMHHTTQSEAFGNLLRAQLFLGCSAIKIANDYLMFIKYEIKIKFLFRNFNFIKGTPVYTFYPSVTEILILFYSVMQDILYLLLCLYELTVHILKNMNI